MRRWSRIALGLAWLATTPAMASDALHRMLVREHYGEARRLGEAALSAAGDAPAARLAALNALLDVGIAERDVHTAPFVAWTDAALALEAQLPRPALLAKACAARALQLRRGDAAQRDAVLQRALDWSRDAAVPAVDRSYVYQVQAILAGDGSHFEQAVQGFEQARRSHGAPREEWPELRAAMLDVLYGAYAERLGRADALAAAERGTARLRALSGDASVGYAFGLTYLGQLRFFRGDYLGAARDTGDAVARLVANGQHDMDLGAALSIRANALRTLGDYDGASAAYAQSIALAQKDPDSANLTGRLNGLGVLQRLTGQSDAARATFARALALVGDADDRRAIPLHGNLGQLALEAGDLEAAATHFRAAYASAARIFGERHAATLDQREGLALTQLARGEAGTAAAELDAVVAAQEAGYGPDYPPLQSTRCARALAHARNGDVRGAWPMALAAERQRLRLLQRVVPVLGAAQALAFKGSLRDCGGLVLALAPRQDEAGALGQAWQLAAATRGIATRLQAQRLAAVREGADAAAQAHWQRWEAATQAYADALVFQRGGDPKALVKAEAALGEAEAALGDSARDAIARLDPPLRLDAALAALGDTRVVAFFQTDAFALEAHAASVWPRSRRYLAFVRDAAGMRLLDLGDAAALDALIARWNRGLRDPAIAAAELAAAGTAVRTTLWDPLRVDGAAALAWIADADVYRVNPLALPEGGGYLAESAMVLSQLESERDLDAPAAPANGQRLLLVGAPDYGNAPAHCRDGLAPLPGTRAEIAAARKAWPAGASLTLSGGAVRKDTLRRDLVGAGALHIATHLVDLEQGCPDAALAQRGASLRRAEPSPAAGRSLALALAGANRYYAGGDRSGLLSVPEVLALPLQHLRFVVLAACDSGSGPVLPGEGVFGLRRAFRLAGAQAVVMSLWPVDDAASADWMGDFYARLARGLSLAEASTAATRDSLLARRASGRSTHPYYWAAYVASGAVR